MWEAAISDLWLSECEVQTQSGIPDDFFSNSEIRISKLWLQMERR